MRTTGLSNLPPWRACERTGQHLGHGEVKGGPPSRASTTVLARRFRADPHEVGRIEGLGLDSLELRRPASGQPVTPAIRRAQSPRTSVGRQPVTADQQSGELVDQGQQIEVSAGHEPEDVAPVSSSTRASDASDAARRSHRSVEGDEKPHGETKK